MTHFFQHLLMNRSEQNLFEMVVYIIIYLIRFLSKSPVITLKCGRSILTFFFTRDMTPIRVRTGCLQSPSRGTPSANISEPSATGSQRCLMKSDTYALPEKQSKWKREKFPKQCPSLKFTHFCIKLHFSNTFTGKERHTWTLFHSCRGGLARATGRQRRPELASPISWWHSGRLFSGVY